MTIKKVNIGCYGTDRNFLTVYNTSPNELRELLKRFYLSVRGYPYTSTKKQSEDPLVALTVQTKNYLKGPNRYKFKMGSNGGVPTFDEFGGIRLTKTDRDTPDIQVTLKGTPLTPIERNQIVKAHDGSLHVVHETLDNNTELTRPLAWIVEIYLAKKGEDKSRGTAGVRNMNQQIKIINQYTKRFLLEHLLKDDTQWNEFLKDFMAASEENNTEATDTPNYGVL